jgi:hypothetical protein
MSNLILALSLADLGDGPDCVTTELSLSRLFSPYRAIEWPVPHQILHTIPRCIQQRAQGVVTSAQRRPCIRVNAGSKRRRAQKQDRLFEGFHSFYAWRG